MGLVYANVKVTNIRENGGSFSAQFLVDTGATDTIIPADELEKIGVERVQKNSYELADGSLVEYDTGYGLIQVMGKKVAANVVFAETGCEPLLGVTVLESAGFVVDPVNKILRKIAIPLK